MSKLYPLTCVAQVNTTPDVYDEASGTWHQGEKNPPFEVECRARPAGSGKKVVGPDGVSREYNFDLSFRLSIGKLPVNCTLTILDVYGDVVFKGPLLRYQFGLLHGRGWV